MNVTITGNYTLPSMGKVYAEDVNPNVVIRSMTTSDEMKRLNTSDRPYKTLADLIDDCMVEGPGISAYDMCLGDFQFLLHRLRAVTYGSAYKISNVCPWCGSTNDDTINLLEMEVLTYTDDFKKNFELDLPRSKSHITLKMQTPRMLDNISVGAKELRKKMSNEAGDPAFLLTIQYAIDTIDGKKADVIFKEDFVRNLPMMDTNIILNAIENLNKGIGLNTELNCTCDICGLDYKSTFRTTSEFFRPTVL